MGISYATTSFVMNSKTQIFVDGMVDVYFNSGAVERKIESPVASFLHVRTLLSSS